MVRLCIFDLDGTLANTLESIAGFANEALAQCGWKAIEPTSEYRFLVGNGADRLIRRMLEHTADRYSEEDVSRLRSVYDALYLSDPMKNVTEYPGLLPVLQRLKKEAFFWLFSPTSRMTQPAPWCAAYSQQICLTCITASVRAFRASLPPTVRFLLQRNSA